jgi:hypothetical protein
LTVRGLLEDSKPLAAQHTTNNAAHLAVGAIALVANQQLLAQPLVGVPVNLVKPILRTGTAGGARVEMSATDQKGE